MMSVKRGAPCLAHNRGSMCCSDFLYEEQPMFTKHPRCTEHGAGSVHMSTLGWGPLVWRGSWNTWARPPLFSKAEMGEGGRQGCSGSDLSPWGGGGFLQVGGRCEGEGP